MARTLSRADRIALQLGEAERTVCGLICGTTPAENVLACPGFMLTDMQVQASYFQLRALLLPERLRQEVKPN